MIFENFDYFALEDPEFKEDSVREELVLPIVKALGYQVSGDSRVVRSRSLVHPYVALGSQQRKVSIVPDYLFLSDGKPYWVLDAKSPSEEITKSKHVEQAYLVQFVCLARKYHDVKESISCLLYYVNKHCLWR